MNKLRDIWIRSRLIVVGPFVSEGESITVSLGGITVVLSYGEHPRDASSKTMLLEARSQVCPDADVTAFLTAVAEGATASTPASVQDFGDSMLAEHSAACRQVLELTRWRYRFESPHAPYASLGSEWSAEGATWHTLPTRVRVSVRGVSGFRLMSATEAAVEALLQANAAEPVAHQLLREAIDVSYTSPRSAVVICVAAIESGFKHLVADLVPDSAWLVENVPSPPLFKMLADYLPMLPARAMVDGKVLAPPKYVRTLVRMGVEDRNKVAHTGEGKLSEADLIQLLEAAGDLLYLFDYYAGNEWALDRVSAKFRTGLGT